MRGHSLATNSKKNGGKQENLERKGQQRKRKEGQNEKSVEQVEKVNQEGDKTAQNW